MCICFAVFIESEKYQQIHLEDCSPSDIIKGFEAASKVDLEDCIDSENGLLYRLGDERIIDSGEIKSLQELKLFRLRNGIILTKVKDNIYSISKQFIKALCKDKQDHIAKFIVTSGCKTDSDERLLPKELRDVIDNNMFCLEKLIDTEQRDLLHRLVRAKCITAQHRDRVIHSKPEIKAYELLIIIQRRRYIDFREFMACQTKNIVNIFEKGGVTEIKIHFQEEQGDNRKIVDELIKKWRGYVGEDNESDLDGDQKKMVIDFLAELAKNGICIIGICPEATPSDSDLSMFFQGEKDDSFQLLEKSCESGALNDKLEALIRSLIPDRLPPLVKEVRIGRHSNKHHVAIQTERSLGKLR